MITRFSMVLALALSALSVAGCETVSEKQDPLAGDVIDEAGLGELLLQANDPNTAVAYFEKAVARSPEREDLRRNLALAYSRAKRYPESARIFQELIALRQDRATDRLEYGFVAARLNRWEDAVTLAGSLPGSLDTPRRHLLDGMVADHNKDWEAADRAYARAEQLSTAPAEVLNNWGVSQMSRGNLAEAERTFNRAVSYDSRLFSAKNNLAISRGLQGNYNLPVVPMTETEQAIVLHNLGMIALQKGEKRIARGLFAAAVETHPQHYEAAANQLAALEATIIN